MGKILIFCGISNSGKSTMAATIVQHNPEQYVIVNRDKLREAHYGYTEETIAGYYHRGDLNYLENQITAVQDNLIRFWLTDGKDIIIDATNLKQSYIDSFKKFDVPTEVQFFDITLKEALTRNMSRLRKVDEKVIEKQYEQYCKLRENYLVDSK